MNRALRSLRAALVLVCTASALHAQLVVSSISPPRASQTVPPDATVLVQFDRPVDPASVPPARATCSVFGSIAGPILGGFALENGDTALRFTPARAFAAGDVVTVALTNQLRGADGTFLRRAGYTWRFRVGAAPAPMSFRLADERDVRDTPGTLVRIYGANTCDLDGDGWVDLPVICEDSSDVRVLMSKCDATGRFENFLAPVYATGARPSPNETCDLDGDGHVDLVLGNVASHAVTLAFGNGDGTFAPRTNVAVGFGPTGVAVFDADGDGDLDIVTANAVGDNLTFLRNTGNSTFAPAFHFDSGGSGEHGLAAEDMDEDGILDLVVTARYSQRVYVLHGTGTGSWTFLSSTYCGGSAWGTALGDVNGDGHIDVTLANSASNNAAILFGDGTGQLFGPAVYATPAYPVATDLGDLDGDGDLDWIVSCHLGAAWQLFANNGGGAFTLVRTFTASQSPACAAIADLDRDRDLDLVLLDELADTVSIFANGSAPATLVCAGDGVDAVCPCANSGATTHGCANSFVPAGAALVASGDPAQDTLALDVSGTPPAPLVVFVAADALQPPVFLGDGIWCGGGGLRRFGRQNAQSGTAHYPSPGDASLSAVSGVTPFSGELRVYQAYYRNTAQYCTSATLNTTSGLAVVW